MAKGNMFLGMARGSVGDVTFYRNQGQQAARARNRNPRNPKTDAQVIQRMILATGSKAYSRMKSIVDHSFENVAYGAQSQSYFLKRALETIRAFVSANYPEMSETSAAKVVGLALPEELLSNALYGAGLLVSQGSLPTIEPALNADGELTGFGTITGAGATPTIAEVLASIGAQAGDQITICGFRQSDGLWQQSRYVINSEATTEQLAAAWDATGAAAAFDADKTLVGSLQLTITDGHFTPSNPMWAYAVILSRKNGSKWLRSTQYMVFASDMGDYPDVDIIVGQWLAGSSDIDTLNARFLNNAESGE